MKYGICTPACNISIVKKLGFDYIETGASYISALNECEFENTRTELLKSGLPCLAANGLFPPNLSLAGNEVNTEKVTEYIKCTFERLGRLGVKTAVFGSGTSRKIPEGFDCKKAYEQLVRLCVFLSDISTQYGITTAIEPLNDRETNIINTQMQGLQLVKDTACRNFKLICDLYHLHAAGEGKNELLQCKDYLVHVHIANPYTRRAPSADDGYDYKAFIDFLVEIGYDSGISIESVSGINEVNPDLLK